MKSEQASKAGKKSRNKGATAEREFCRRVASLTDGRIQLRRNLTQCRDCGDDTGTDRFSIEIKRYKTVTDAKICQWWTQCQRNAAAQEKTPVLAFRADQQSWQILMHPNLFFDEHDIRGCVRMGIDLFCQWMEHPDLFKTHGGH